MFMSSNANLAKRQLSAVVAMMLGALILPSLVQPLQAPSLARKDDYSSTYIGVNHMRCDRFMVYVDGAKDGYGNGRTNCTEYGAAAVRHTGNLKSGTRLEKGILVCVAYWLG